MPVAVVLLGNFIVVAEVVLKDDPVGNSILVLIGSEKWMIEVNAVVDDYHGVAAAVEVGKPRIGAQQVQSDQRIGGKRATVLKPFDG